MIDATPRPRLECGAVASRILSRDCETPDPDVLVPSKQLTEALTEEIHDLRAQKAEILRTVDKVLEGFNSGVFIRNTSGDHESDWAVKAMPYLRAVGQLQAFVDDEPRKVEG